MSLELNKQFFFQGTKEKFITGFENSKTFQEKLLFIESLINYHDYDQALNLIRNIEEKELISKKEQKILLTMLKSLCFTKPSEQLQAFRLLEDVENTLTKIQNSTIPLGEEFIIYLYTKGQVFFNFLQIDTSLTYFRDCVHKSSSSGNKFYQARALNKIALIYFEKENFEQAMESSMQALAIATANKFHLEIFLGYEMLGLVNQNKNKEQSFKYFDQCLKISINQLQNDVLTAKALMNIGKNKLLQKQLDEANHYWLESLNFYNKAAFNTDQPIILRYLGDLSSRKGNFNQAIEYYNKSLELCSKDDKQNEGIVLFAMASVYFRIRDFKNALKYYSESLQIKRKIGNKIDLAGCLWGIGHVNFIRKEYSKALSSYAELYEIYKEFGKAEYTSEILLIIITLQNEISAVSEVKKYCDSLQELVINSPSEHTRLSFNIAQALSKEDNRLITLYEKLVLFKQTSLYLAINHHFTYFSLLNIIFIYLREFSLTEELPVLDTIRTYAVLLQNQSIRNYSYPMEILANLILIQLNYLEDKKEENIPLLVKNTTILETIEIKQIETENIKVLKKIDALEKDKSSKSSEITKNIILNRLGLIKLVKKIILEKYWL